MNENEKDKEIKKTPEAYSDEDYEGEEMEGAEESPGLEEASESEGSLLIDICQTPRDISVSESHETDAGSALDSEEEKKRLLLRERWQTITGKRPRNIPVVRKFIDDLSQKFIFFGDRKPREADKEIKRKLLIASKRLEEDRLKFGKVRHELILPALSSGLLCIRFHPGGEFIAHCDRRGEVQVRKTSTGAAILSLKGLEMSENVPVRTVRYFLNTEKLYVAGECGTVQVFDTNSGQLLGYGEKTDVINILDFSADGSYLATGGRAGRITIVDPQTLQIISERSWPDDAEFHPNVYDEYHRLRIYALKFHPTDTNAFVTGGMEGSVKVWDVRTKAAVRSLKCPLICGDGVDVANDKILTASWQAENSLALWDYLSGRLIKQIPVIGKYTKFEGEFLYTAKFFEDNPSLGLNSNIIAVGGSGFTEAMVLDTRNDKVLQIFPSLKEILCLDVCNNLIAYGGKESLVRIAELRLKSK